MLFSSRLVQLFSHSHTHIHIYIAFDNPHNGYRTWTIKSENANEFVSNPFLFENEWNYLAMLKCVVQIVVGNIGHIAYRPAYEFKADRLNENYIFRPLANGSQHTSNERMSIGLKYAECCHWWTFSNNVYGHQTMQSTQNELNVFFMLKQSDHGRTHCTAGVYVYCFRYAVDVADDAICRLLAVKYIDMIVLRFQNQCHSICCCLMGNDRLIDRRKCLPILRAIKWSRQWRTCTVVRIFWSGENKWNWIGAS